MTQPYIGTPLTRKEDVRFLTGRATYTDDFKAQHLLHAAILRSPHPHANIRSIDVSEAREMPCCRRFHYRDWKPPSNHSLSPSLGPPARHERFLQYPMARARSVRRRSRRRRRGDSRYTAEDALVHTSDYEPLPPVVDVRQSLTGQSLLHQEHDTNVAAEYTVGFGDVEAAFRDAEYTRREEFRCHRHTGVPMETRGLLASYDPGRQELTVWGETKVPHFNRGVLSSLLQMPEHRIHFIEGDVGGGSASPAVLPRRLHHPLRLHPARRPIKWIEDARDMYPPTHSREHVCEIEIAANRDGTSRYALQGYGDVGAMCPPTAACNLGTAVGLTGPYRISHFDCQFRCMLTNKTGMAPARSRQLRGRLLRERLVDMVAEDLDMDPRRIAHEEPLPLPTCPTESA